MESILSHILQRKRRSKFSIQNRGTELLRLFIFGLFLFSLPTFVAAADTVFTPVTQSIVLVVCDTRQGSGAVTNARDGYVVTAGHVVIDPNTRTVAKECEIGFITNQTLKSTTYYHASVVHAIFDERTDRDFAVLKIGQRINGSSDILFSEISTNEFAVAGDQLKIFGFPSASEQKLSLSSGTLLGFNRGIVRTDIVISEGYSGGPALDVNDHLVGVAERVSVEVDKTTGVQTVIDYELGDIMTLITWLDSFSPREHDRYLTHADPIRFDNAPFVIRREESGCTHLTRIAGSTTLYCLLNSPERLVFPNFSTYASWYSDFSSVELIELSNLAEFRLIGNVTFRAGTLIKIQTDPKVYLVADNIGTLRWIQSETTARTLFGDNWGTKVHDVPDAFFTDYHVAEPIL